MSYTTFRHDSQLTEYISLVHLLFQESSIKLAWWDIVTLKLQYISRRVARNSQWGVGLFRGGVPALESFAFS